jgi:glycosyltransferase involved in cell wall biosynthesis
MQKNTEKNFKKMINCTVLIMTYNESHNIAACLNSVVDKFERVCVVDSYSTDNTLEIIKTFKNVEIYNNEFESWGTQRNWIFKNANVKSDYVLFLDADEIISDLLAKELSHVLKKNEIDNAKFAIKNIFLGKWIKYSYGHPAIVRIFRTATSPNYHAEGAREYPTIKGKQFFLKNALIHCDQRPIEQWFQKHISNAKREADYLLNEAPNANSNKTIKDLIRNRLWIKLPIFLRSLLYFIYRYIFRLGFLDGTAGFIFCFFQAYSYQNMISTFIYEQKK